MHSISTTTDAAAPNTADNGETGHNAQTSIPDPASTNDERPATMNNVKSPEVDIVEQEKRKEAVETPVPAASPTPAASSADNDDKEDSTALVARATDGYYTSKYFIGSMAAIGLSAVSGIGGFALAASILTAINADIGPSPNLDWVSIVYLITQTIGQLILGRLTDLFGRRHFFFGCSVLALIGSIVCATAKNVDVLIGGNTIMGLASAAQMSFPYLVTEIVPINWRFYSMGYVYTIAIPFTAIGPVVAQSFNTTASGWRGIYYMFIAINVVAAATFWLFYYPPNFDIKHSRDKLTKMQIIKDFDYIGLVLFSGGLLVFLLGLQWGGNLHPWNSSWVIASIVVGGIAVIAFCFWEAYAPIKEPLVPPHLMKSWSWFATVMNLSLGVSLVSVDATVMCTVPY
jgi:MFS family permease